MTFNYVPRTREELLMQQKIIKMRRQLVYPRNDYSPEVLAKIAELEAELACEEAKLSAENSSL